MRTTGQTPINRPAAWAWAGSSETFQIAEAVGWANVETGDARGEFQRQIERVRDRWRRRWLAEWRE